MSALMSKKSGEEALTIEDIIFITTHKPVIMPGGRVGGMLFVVAPVGQRPGRNARQMFFAQRRHAASTDAHGAASRRHACHNASSVRETCRALSREEEMRV